MLPLTNTFPFAMCVAAGVGGCLWYIYVRGTHMAVPCWQLTNRGTNYDSIALNRTFHIVVNSKLMIPISGCCFDGVFPGSFD